MSSCELTSKTNICKFRDCIESIDSFERNSYSFSDGWIFNLKDKNYVDKVFVKIFIDPKSLSNEKNIDIKNLKKKLEEAETENDFSNIKSLIKNKKDIYIRIRNLEYELKVYKKLIKPMIEGNVCPNFINYITSSKCWYDNIVNLLKGKLIFKEPISLLSLNTLNEIDIIDDEYKIRGVLNRTISEKFLKDFVKTQIIHKEPIGSLLNFEDYLEKMPNKNYKYSMIMLEYIEGSFTFEKFVLDNVKYTMEDVWNCLIQIAIACYTLFLNRTNHNDLHSRNILINKLDNPEMFEYKLNGEKYKIYTRYIPLIYDYDVAYCEKIGVNKFTKNDLFVYLNGEKINYNYDKINEMKDFFRMLEDVQELRGIKYFVMECMKSSNMVDIIDNIYSKLDKKNRKGNVPKANMYDCDVKIF